MTLNDYYKGAKSFSEESKDWANIDPYKHYVATPTGWVETCDNGENGIDISWAFHEQVTKDMAEQNYMEAYDNMIYQSISEEWGDEQLLSICNLFEDVVTNSGGHTFRVGHWDAIVKLMDDDIREFLNKKIAPCSNMDFFTAYALLHEQTFGEQWELDKANPCW